jgi:hypothetical protein
VIVCPSDTVTAIGSPGEGGAGMEFRGDSWKRKQGVKLGANGRCEGPRRPQRVSCHCRASATVEQEEVIRRHISLCVRGLYTGQPSLAIEAYIMGAGAEPFHLPHLPRSVGNVGVKRQLRHTVPLAVGSCGNSCALWNAVTSALPSP